MNKEPLFAINVVIYCKSLISMCVVNNNLKTKKILNCSRISKSRPLESVPTGKQPCWMRAAREREGKEI